MNTPRRERSDSVQNLLRLATQADAEFAPPAHIELPEEAWPYWHNVMAEQARADWTGHAMEVAAHLSVTMARLEENQRALRTEGFVYLNSRGDPAVNPRQRVVSTLTAQTLAYRRSLGLTARAQAGGRSEVAAARRIANRNFEQGFRDSDGNLLA